MWTCVCGGNIIKKNQQVCFLFTLLAEFSWILTERIFQDKLELFVLSCDCGSGSSVVMDLSADKSDTDVEQ